MGQGTSAKRPSQALMGGSAIAASGRSFRRWLESVFDPKLILRLATLADGLLWSRDPLTGQKRPCPRMRDIARPTKNGGCR